MSATKKSFIAKRQVFSDATMDISRSVFSEQGLRRNRTRCPSVRLSVCPSVRP